MKLAYFLLTSSVFWASGQKFPSVPSPTKFLEMLFNATALEVLEIAKKFDFDTIYPEQVHFLAYHDDGTFDTYNVNNTDTININASEPIKFIIHGWQSSAEMDWVKSMAKSYHAIGIKNVFAVDWASHAKKNYLHSAGGTKKIGEIVGEFIVNLLKNETGPLCNVHIIGHSLGAQISGFAGKHVQALTNGERISRITALDAAAPLFELPLRLPSWLRVSDADAHFVDSLHTNAGFMGFLGPFADADFYIEFGGPLQPGCDKQPNIFEGFVCSHGKSHDIWLKTIQHSQMMYEGISCAGPVLALAGLCSKNERARMGEHGSHDADGEYYVRIDKDGKPSNSSSTIGLPIIDKVLPEFKSFG